MVDKERVVYPPTNELGQPIGWKVRIRPEQGGDVRLYVYTAECPSIMSMRAKIRKGWGVTCRIPSIRGPLVVPDGYVPPPADSEPLEAPEKPVTPVLED